ncbi:MAG: hypothetical protein WCW01_03730 [Gammaproteobacteria bacterium]
MKKKLLISILVSSVFALQNVSAAEIKFSKVDPFKLKPLLQASIYGGRAFLVEAQGLLPVTGDVNHVFFLDAEGKTGVSGIGWSSGLAAGYRQIINNRIWGGYIFTTYSQTNNHLNTWLLNPGIESLGSTWDFRINGYLPFSKRNFDQTSVTSNWGFNLEDYQYVHFSGNDMYDRWITDTCNNREETGVGLDAEVGRTIPWVKNLKAYVGGYHFATTHLGPINGASARLTYDMNNHLALEAKYTYDNDKKNVAMLGLRLTLGGINKEDKNSFGISGRLLDPIEHNMATAAKGNAAPTIAKAETIRTVGAETASSNSVYFVGTGTTTSSKNVPHQGTAEDPYTNIMDIEGIDSPSPIIFLSQGTYDLSEISGLKLELPPNFHLFGWHIQDTYDGVQGRIAEANEVKLINGNVELSATGDTSLHNITVENIIEDPIQTQSADRTIVLNNIIIQSPSVAPSTTINTAKTVLLTGVSTNSALAIKNVTRAYIYQLTSRSLNVTTADFLNLYYANFSSSGENTLDLQQVKNASLYNTINFGENVVTPMHLTGTSLYVSHLCNITRKSGGVESKISLLGDSSSSVYLHEGNSTVFSSLGGVTELNYNQGRALGTAIYKDMRDNIYSLFNSIPI